MSRTMRAAWTCPLLIALVSCGGEVVHSDDGTNTPDSHLQDAGGSDATVPQSCAVNRPGAGRNCGLSGTDDCCASLKIPGGTFYRFNDGVAPLDKHDYPATVSPFYLDQYEITVGRFRAFVEQYPAWRPSPGDGAHPRIPGSGWRSEWPLPKDQAALRANVSDTTNCTVGVTWTDSASEDERLPMNCINWYELFAFCAWDGGRLPTEAESQFALLGGDEQRFYPWSVPPTSQVVDETYAVYLLPSGPFPGSPQPVGFRPKGWGRWGQMDLAGNVAESFLDWYADPPPTPCEDCARLPSASQGEAHSAVNGHFDGLESLLRSAIRGVVGADQRASMYGGRCARDR